MRISEFLKQHKDYRSYDSAKSASLVTSIEQPSSPSAEEIATPPEVLLEELEKKIKKQLEEKFSKQIERLASALEKKSEPALSGKSPPSSGTEAGKSFVGPSEQNGRDAQSFEEAVQKKVEEEKKKLEAVFQEKINAAQEKWASQKGKTNISHPSGLISLEKEDETQESDSAKVLLDLDPKIEATAKAIRDDLLEAVMHFFEQVQQQKMLNLEKIRFILGTLVTLIANRDLELMRLALEPYPAGKNHFVLHGINVAILSLVLAQEFEFSRDELLELGLGAVLHDLGLLSAMGNLNDPKRLTPEMERQVLDHPIRGAEILKGAVSQRVEDAILQHHEVGNGKGYPRQLRENEIHIFGSIIQVADSFEALIHQRPYRETPLEVNEAIKQLIDSGRGVYHRNVLKALMVRIGLYPVMTYVELSNRSIAQVIKQNRQYPLSPIVRVEIEETGMRVEKPYMIDLSQTQFLHILGPIKKQSGLFSPSRFAATEVAAGSEKKKEVSELVQNLFSLILIVTILGIVIYGVIRI